MGAKQHKRRAPFASAGHANGGGFYQRLPRAGGQMSDIVETVRRHAPQLVDMVRTEIGRLEDEIARLKRDLEIWRRNGGDDLQRAEIARLRLVMLSVIKAWENASASLFRSNAPRHPGIPHPLVDALVNLREALVNSMEMDREKERWQARSAPEEGKA